MKAIFLDIDGVFNFIGCRDKIGSMYFVNDHKIKLFKQIIDTTNAKIILSSTWRKGWFDQSNGLDTESGYHFQKLKDKFLEYDLEFIARTPITSDGYRGAEIDMFLKGWKGESITNFIILDDDTDMKPYMEHLIQTSWKTGLLPKHVDKAIKILNT